MQRGNFFFCFYFPTQWLKSVAGVSNLHFAHSNQFRVSDTTTTNVANVIWIFPSKKQDAIRRGVLHHFTNYNLLKELTFKRFCGCRYIIQWNLSAVVATGMGSITWTSNCFLLYLKAKPLVLCVHCCSGASQWLAIIADHKSGLWTNCCWMELQHRRCSYLVMDFGHWSFSPIYIALHICITNQNK